MYGLPTIILVKDGQKISGSHHEGAITQVRYVNNIKRMQMHGRDAHRARLSGSHHEGAITLVCCDIHKYNETSECSIVKPWQRVVYEMRRQHMCKSMMRLNAPTADMAQAKLVAYLEKHGFSKSG